MSTAVVVLPPLAAPVDQLWHALLDLGEALQENWTLVGGQMILLHALEHGHTPPTISQDGDVVADVRASRGALQQIVAALTQADFELESISTDQVAHRYACPTPGRPVIIDVLAPEGLGPRASLVTTPPGRTIEVPGGTQALERSEKITVEHEGRRATLPRPSLLGAIVAKAAATQLPGPARHYRDLALLCALVADPFALLEQLTKKDRRRIRSASALADPNHPAWALVPGTIRSDGHSAYMILQN